MSAPLPPGWTRRPAGSAQTGKQDERPTWMGTILESCIRDVALGRIASHSSVTPELVAEWKRLNPDRAAEFYDPPAPSAGQDTERLRDELAAYLGELRGEAWPLYDAADALLDGPLRQLIAERDQAREQGPWRVGNHYGIHVYEGDRPVATFHTPEDAARAVEAVNKGVEESE